MDALTTCLWFDGTAEDAARFYVTLLPGSRIETVVRPPLDWPGGRAGTALTVAFTLRDQRFLGLNGGSNYKLSPAASIMVPCEDQAEIDRLWDALLADGGSAMACGWLTDRFGLSWQIYPKVMSAMMRDPDPAKVRRVMEAFMPMVKLDVATIVAAYRAE